MAGPVRREHLVRPVQSPFWGESRTQPPLLAMFAEGRNTDVVSVLVHQRGFVQPYATEVWPTHFVGVFGGTKSDHRAVVQRDVGIGGELHRTPCTDLLSQSLEGGIGGVGHEDAGWRADEIGSIGLRPEHHVESADVALAGTSPATEPAVESLGLVELKLVRVETQFVVWHQPLGWLASGLSSR